MHPNFAIAQAFENIKLFERLEFAMSNRFSLPILKMVKQQQLEHGLRHRDYTQYRRYCTNRARRLRRFLNFKDKSLNQ